MDVGSLIVGKEHTGAFWDRNMLLLAAMRLSISGNLGLKKEPDGHKRVQNSPVEKEDFVHFETTFLLHKSSRGQ